MIPTGQRQQEPTDGGWESKEPRQNDHPPRSSD